MKLTLEEFGWRCLWLDAGRLHDYIAPFYQRRKVRDLVRRAKRDESSVTRYDGVRTEWTKMVENWYRQEGGIL